MKIRRNNKARGFTLIEVLVALAIVGIALPALILRTQKVLVDASHITTKSYAYWLAENKLQEMMITQRLQGDVVKKRKQQDKEKYAGIDWYWKVESQETEVEKMYRLNVSVGLEEDHPLATLVGFINE